MSPCWSLPSLFALCAPARQLVLLHAGYGQGIQQSTDLTACCCNLTSTSSIDGCQDSARKQRCIQWRRQRRRDCRRRSCSCRRGRRPLGLVAQLYEAAREDELGHCQAAAITSRAGQAYGPPHPGRPRVQVPEMQQSMGRAVTNLKKQKFVMPVRMLSVAALHAILKRLQNCCRALLLQRPQQQAALRQRATRSLRTRSTRLPTCTKPPPPQVDVKVDFLRPTFQAIEESAQAIWTQLPPPVQQAAPYVGVGLGTGLIVFAVQQHRLKHQARAWAPALDAGLHVGGRRHVHRCLDGG